MSTQVGLGYRHLLKATLVGRYSYVTLSYPIQYIEVRGHTRVTRGKGPQSRLPSCKTKVQMRMLMLASRTKKGNNYKAPSFNEQGSRDIK
eukprot:1146779-Pelagomonas_calceolata.AAC.1